MGLKSRPLLRVLFAPVERGLVPLKSANFLPERLQVGIVQGHFFDVLLAGRKLFNSIRYHSREETYNFKKP